MNLNYIAGFGDPVTYPEFAGHQNDPRNDHGCSYDKHCQCPGCVDTDDEGDGEEF